MSSSAGTLTGFKAIIDTGYKQNPTAYGAIRLIADNVARIPLIVYEDRGSELVEVGPSHPAQKTIDRPNATYNGVRFRQALMTDLMLAGSYYAQDTVTSVQSFQHFIYRLRPDWVTPKLNAQKTAIEAFEYSPNGSTKGILIAAEDVLHGWFIDPLDDTKGFAPIKVATASIGLANDARTWNSSLMANKGQHSNLIKVNGDMPPEEEKALRESFSAKFSGKDNAGKSIVIRNGEIDVVPLNLSPADVEWVEGVKLTLRNVATALFVPSVLLNDTENNTYSNYSAAIRIFYTMTVFPLLDMLCDDLTWFLVARFGDSIRVRYNADEVPALQPNREEKWQQVQNVDWLTINEKREFLGWGKLEEPDADKVWIPATLVPLGAEIPDFPDNTEGRGGVTRLETRAAKRPRAWLAIERMRSPLYKSVQRRLADYFRDELRELQAMVPELSPATAADRLEEAVENRRDELQRLMDGLSQSI
ncbi:MAG TPA: phage portal protein, partial [Candidatus Latescibacteria bacterium]|nr:phage portal protein [Candidatus Latescibacterota bacterium]